MVEVVYRIPLLVPMRDGVHLAGDLYTTDSPSDLTAKPVVLERTCYDRYADQNKHQAEHLARRGYSAVVQACRGRHESGGEWIGGQQEAADGYDTIEWLAVQNFANGDVGTYGASYPGWVQMAAESLHPPHLKTMIVTSGCLQTMRAYGRDRNLLLPRSMSWIYKMSNRNMRDRDDVDWNTILRHRPLIDAADSIPDARDMWRTWMENSDLPDPTANGDNHKIEVPTLHITGWEDEPGQALIYGQAVRSGSQDQYLLVGPWDHPGTRVPQQITKGYDYGTQSLLNINEIHAKWFDSNLKDGPAFSDSGRAGIFTTGLNEWRTYADWPLEGNTKLTYHLAAQSDVAGQNGHSGVLQVDRPEVDGSMTIHHDPVNPVMYQSTAAYIDPAARNELSPVENLDGVLSFSTGVLDEPLLIDGNMTLTFPASATAESADWCVWIAEVDPELGVKRLAANVTRIENPPHETHPVTVVVGPISHVVAAGKELKCFIAGSHFPIWDSNLGIAGFDATTSDYVESDNTLYTGPASDARLVIDTTSMSDFSAGLSFPTE